MDPVHWHIAAVAGIIWWVLQYPGRQWEIGLCGLSLQPLPSLPAGYTGVWAAPNSAAVGLAFRPCAAQHLLAPELALQRSHGKAAIVIVRHKLSGGHLPGLCSPRPAWKGQSLLDQS